MITQVYHITHHDNLASMIAQGDLVCDKQCAALNLATVNIAHANIKDRRSSTQVPLGPDGMLDEYVPFYFAPRSPMLYSIHNGYVQGYAGGQRCIVHLVTDCQAVAASGLPFVFTDGHAVMTPLSHFYDDLAHLGKIDWSVMSSMYWNDTQAQPDRKRRRQAEFLVHRTFPWNLVKVVGVHNAAAKQMVEGILQQGDHRPNVIVRPDWYY